MPRSKWPEHTRMKATRSRWFGSMLACTLKTKPATLSSDGETVRCSAGCGRGDGACLPRPVDQLLHGEILQRRAEIDRRQMTFAIGLEIERRDSHRARARSPRARCACSSALKTLRPSDCARPARRPRPERQEHVGCAKSIDAAEVEARADRPHRRRHVQLQRVGDLVHQRERIARLAVHLVDEGDDRNVAQAADLEQLARLRSRCPWRRRSP